MITGTYSKLYPEFKKAWLTALRSGTFPQTQAALHRKTAADHYPAGYCCVGVACRVAEKLGVAEFEVGESLDGQLQYFDGEGAFAPITLERAMFNYNYGFGGDTLSKLYSMNDTEKKSFNEIADWIEENL